MMRSKYENFVYRQKVIAKAKAITFVIYFGCCMVQS